MTDAPMLYITARAEPEDELASMASGAAAILNYRSPGEFKTTSPRTEMVPAY